MSHSHMMVFNRRSPGSGLRQMVVRCWLAWLVAIVGMVAVPATAEATPDQQIAAAATSPQLHDLGVRPQMCRPEPPDYPGCSPAQVRPLLRAVFKKEYT